MKKIQWAAMILPLFSLTATASENATWSYVGGNGPAHWGEISPEFSECKTGVNQSPVDLGHLVDAKLPKIAFSYYAPPRKIINNGHTVQVTTGANNKIMIDDDIFELKQMHFHSPSEHTINGKHFPLEAHFVHKDKSGHIAVVAVMFHIDKPNHSIATLWDQVPGLIGETATLKPPTGTCGLAPEVGACGLLPRKKDYVRYSGSLTTPPCSEGVIWIVLKKTMSVSKEQVLAFRRGMTHPNNRPVQPLNARLALE